LNYFNY